MKNIGLLIIVVLLCNVMSLKAQENEIVSIADAVGLSMSVATPHPADTVVVPEVAIEQLGDTPMVFLLSPGERLHRNQYFAMAYVGVPLVVAGVATQGCTSMRFKELRDAYAPHFHHSYDDYLQYAPGVALLITKACGVEGRSSWERMIVSDVFSVALMAGVTNGLKYSVGTMRPDGSKANSFPSGHTATAFMAAHMLHKEYGHVSPWISVGGYTVATVVGASRILNNRHWISDVLAGAGIGILSVELGYLFADLIYKDKGLYHVSTPDFTIAERPSFVGLNVGLSLPLASISIGDGRHLVASIGSRAGVEGAWYVNEYTGIGASVAVATHSATLDEYPDDHFSIDAATMAAGAYASIPLSEGSRFRFNMKALVGSNYISNTTLLPDVLTLDSWGFYYELGASFSVVARRHFGASLFCDYGGHCLGMQHTPSQVYGLTRNGRYNYMLHSATIGLSTSILF